VHKQTSYNKKNYQNSDHKYKCQSQTQEYLGIEIISKYKSCPRQPSFSMDF